MNNILKIMIVVLVAVLAVGFAVLASGGGMDAVFGGNDGGAVVATEQTPAAESSAAADSGDSFSFSATALDGSTVDESIFEGKSLIMLNMWEPWCGPCVGEMPDLQRLYEEYADRGFLLLGVYSTADGVENIIGRLGISYPIIKSTADFDRFVTGYVPTSVFLDAEGRVLGELVIGRKSYEGWKAIIDAYIA